MEVVVLTRGIAGALFFAPLEAVTEGLTVIGIAVITPEQERSAREIADAMLREAMLAVHAA